MMRLNFYIVKTGLLLLLLITMVPDLPCEADTVIRIIGRKNKEVKPQIEEETTQPVIILENAPKKKIRIIGDRYCG